MAHHHGHDHSQHHHGHHHHGDSSNGNKKALVIALTITTAIMLVEFFGGIITNSLALISDSGHMLSDASALVLSLVAMWFAARPASPSKTYGYYRFEILAALFNGVTLFLIAGFIIWEAWDRFFAPPNVASGSMMLIATIGLIANLLSAWALMTKGDVKDNINLKSAYLHVLGDALGSVGAIVAGALMYFFSWNVSDPIISVIVALLVLKSAWGIIQHSVHILMEGTPVTVDKDKVVATLKEIDGVNEVHDLHIWTISSGLDSLTCHLIIDEARDTQDILQQAIDKVKEKFKIEHTTIQIETPRLRHSDCKIGVH